MRLGETISLDYLLDTGFGLIQVTYNDFPRYERNGRDTGPAITLGDFDRLISADDPGVWNLAHSGPLSSFRAVRERPGVWIVTEVGRGFA